MKWPSQSHINPLEHIWNWLKADLDKLGSRPTSPDALWEWLQAAWGRVPMSLITSVVDGMPRRVAAVIEARGDAPSINPILLGAHGAMPRRHLFQGISLMFLVQKRSTCSLCHAE